MNRIISDTYVKQNKQIWGDDPNTDFNRKILAVNNMYGWLYENGILEKTSFIFKDYETTSHFAIDVKNLLPYRKQMENAQIGGADLAVRHIFDEPYTPCLYSGAIELGWTMRSYRSTEGCVGSSWECGLVQCLNNDSIFKISEIKDELGIKAAVNALYDEFDWNLTIPEQKQYQNALDYFSNESNTNIENDYVKNHSRELIFCYEHGKSLLDFDFWTRYEDICNEKLSFDEYIAIDSSFDGDPLEINPIDVDLAEKFKETLRNYRQSVRNPIENKRNALSVCSSMQKNAQQKESHRSLSEKIAAASSNSGKQVADSGTKYKSPER